MSTPDQWRWLFRADPDGGGFTADQLGAAVALVADAVPGAAACSITEFDGETYRTAAASTPVALELDLSQYAHGDGPCMTAAREQRRQQVPDTTSAPRYRGFATTAAESGIRSSLSVPIRTGRHRAALNIYSRRAEGFSERAVAVADLLGRAMTARVLDATADRPLTPDESHDVARRRALIRAAQTVLGGDGPEAFASLARRSAREQRSIFALAADLTAAPEQPA